MQRQPRCQRHLRLTSRLFLSDSRKEEEIAKLEEQLRRLKEEADADQVQIQKESQDSAQVVLPQTNPDSYIGRGPAKRPVTPMDEMVSEAWKAEQAPEEIKEKSGLGGTMTTVLGAIGLVVLLAIFAQTPVGQDDMSKYQGAKTPTQIDLGDLNPSRPRDY